MVGAFFFQTLGRLCLAAVVLIGPVEFALHKGVQEFPELSNAHYNFTISAGNESPVPTFVPADKMCQLPPSQPYAFQLGVNGAKITSCAVILGGVPNDLKGSVPRWKVASLRLMTFYQWIMVPLSMILTIVHFARMGPFESWWGAYECFGILWTLGPWWFNIFLMCIKCMFQEGPVGKAILDKTAMSAATATDIFKQPLMSQKDVEHAKGKSFAITVVITVFPYFLIWTPFCFTHLLPAMLIFFPQNALVVAIFVALTWCISFDSDGKRLGFSQVFDIGNGIRTIARMRMLEKAAALHYLPALAGIAILSEIMMLEATYFYAGDGWFNSMAEAWLERRSDYYFLSFKQKVLHQYYALADLMNEAT